MKYIKVFEEMGKYNIGDYVHLENDESWLIYPDVRIIDRHSNKKSRHHDEELFDDYYIESQMKMDNRNFWIGIDDIERRSTLEEIENYKLRLDVNKYNL